MSLYRHVRQQIVRDQQRKNVQWTHQQGQVQMERIDFSDIYLPPSYLSQHPRTYGMQQQLTVLRTGKILGFEAVF